MEERWSASSIINGTETSPSGEREWQRNRLSTDSQGGGCENEEQSRRKNKEQRSKKAEGVDIEIEADDEESDEDNAPILPPEIFH